MTDWKRASDEQVERAFVLLVRQLATLHHTMQVMGENDMGVLSNRTANRFHKATDMIRALVNDLSQDALWPHEPGEGIVPMPTNYDLACKVHDIRNTLAEQRTLLDGLDSQIKGLLNDIRTA